MSGLSRERNASQNDNYTARLSMSKPGKLPQFWEKHCTVLATQQTGIPTLYTVKYLRQTVFSSVQRCENYKLSWSEMCFSFACVSTSILKSASSKSKKKKEKTAIKVSYCFFWFFACLTEFSHSNIWFVFPDHHTNLVRLCIGMLISQIRIFSFIYSNYYKRFSHNSVL